MNTGSSLGGPSQVSDGSSSTFIEPSNSSTCLYEYIPIPYEYHEYHTVQYRGTVRVAAVPHRYSTVLRTAGRLQLLVPVRRLRAV